MYIFKQAILKLTTNDILIFLQVFCDDQSQTVHEIRDGQSVYDHYLIMIKDIKELTKARHNHAQEITCRFDPAIFI